MADPFDISGGNRPSPDGGISPDTWRNLMAFGAAMSTAANARTPQGFLTYGNGFAGPLGAGIQGAMAQNMEAARGRSALGLQSLQGQNLQSEIQSRDLQNQRLSRQIDIMNDPSFLGGVMGGSQSASAAPGGGYTGSDYRTAIFNGEGLGSNSRSSSSGYGGFIESTWQKFAQAHPTLFQGMTPEQILAARGNKQIAGMAVDWLAQENGRALEAAGVKPTGEALGMAHMLGPVAAGAVMKASPSAPIAPVLADSIGIRQASAYLNANPDLLNATVGDLRQRFAKVPDPMPAAPQPDRQLLGLAQAAERQALQWSAAGFPGANPFTAQANQYREMAFAGPQAYSKEAAVLPLAGPKAEAEAAAKAPYAFQEVRPGGALFQGGKPIGSVPLRSNEVVSSGPTAGQEEQVFRDPLTGQPIPGAPVVTKLAPQIEGRLKAAGELEGKDIETDREKVEKVYSSVLSNTVPAKQQLLQMRDLIDPSSPGAAGEVRAQFRNWVQTFAPDFISKLSGDASPAQEFKKLALMGAGKQERETLGARGGFQAMQLYINANPSLEMQPDANRFMSNALLVSQQYNEDYGRGLNDFYQRSRAAFPDAKYRPTTQFDKEFGDKFRPELYKSAIDAINGKPSDQWAKGLTPAQVQIVGGILQRADPNAVVDVNGKMRPVSAFSTTFSPNQIGAKP